MNAQERLDNYNEVMQIMRGNLNFISPEYSENTVLSIDEILKVDGILYIGSVVGENPLTDIEFHSLKKNIFGKATLKPVKNADLKQKLYELYKQENDYRYDFENNCIRQEYIESQQAKRSWAVPEWAYGVSKETQHIFIMKSYIEHVMQIDDDSWLIGVCQLLLDICIENEWNIDEELVTGKKVDSDEFCVWFANYIYTTFKKLLESGKEAVVYHFDNDIKVAFVDE